MRGFQRVDLNFCLEVFRDELVELPLRVSRGPLMRWLLPLARWTGLVPLVRVFTRSALESAMREAGFDIVESWKPDSGMAVFSVARKR